MAARHPCVAFSAQRHPSKVGGVKVGGQQGAFMFSGERCRLSRPRELTCCCTTSPVHSLAELRRRGAALSPASNQRCRFLPDTTAFHFFLYTSQIAREAYMVKAGVKKNNKHINERLPPDNSNARGGLHMPRVGTQTRIWPDTSQQYGNSSTFIDAIMESKTSVRSNGSECLLFCDTITRSPYASTDLHAAGHGLKGIRVPGSA